eukprot:4349720-Lingulodinium_polyedra.AAC.1
MAAYGCRWLRTVAYNMPVYDRGWLRGCVWSRTVCARCGFVGLRTVGYGMVAYGCAWLRTVWLCMAWSYMVA